MSWMSLSRLNDEILAREESVESRGIVTLGSYDADEVMTPVEGNSYPGRS